MKKAEYTLSIDNIQGLIRHFDKTPDYIAKILKDVTEQITVKKEFQGMIMIETGDDKSYVLFRLEEIKRAPDEETINNRHTFGVKIKFYKVGKFN